MKLKALDAAAATAQSPVNWFSGTFFAALTIISASAAADTQTSAEGWTPAEQWVAERVTAGQEANLYTAQNANGTKKFPKQEDRKLSAHFLEALLTGTLPGVQPQGIGVRILWAIIDESIDINNERIPWDIWLEYCQFMSRATIHHASFAWNVSFQNSTFKDVADFNSVKVGNVAWFLGADFEGPVDFSYANITGEFGAKWATFQINENGGVSRAVFSGMKVGGDATFYSAVFEGPVDFSYANITNNFNANEAEFQDQKNGAVFSGMKVGNDALFAGAEFEGPVDFRYANIANNFNANEAEFQDQRNGAVFSGMKVGGDATFYSAVFDGPVHFNHADFARLSLSSPFSPKVAAQFHMQGMSYKYIRAVPQPEPSPRSDIIPRRAYPLYPASPELHIIPWPPPPRHRQPTAFIRAVLQPEPSPGLYIIPRRPAPRHRQTTAFIRAVSQPEAESESTETLLNLAHDSAYSADVYSSLEQFFLRQGDRGDADNAFIAGKSRERDEYRRSGHWFGWLRSWMLYLLVGYGRRPWQAGIPCAVLVALGCVLFSPKKMEPQKPEDTPRVYSRFWYSLGLFLPFVDLQADKVWKPKADQTFLRNYMRVHILLGWILIPIVLAALTGLIK